MQFDQKSSALVKKSSIALALVYTSASVYWHSLYLFAFGLLCIAFVPISVWASDCLPWYVCSGLLALLQQQQQQQQQQPAILLNERHRALIAPAGQ